MRKARVGPVFNAHRPPKSVQEKTNMKRNTVRVAEGLLTRLQHRIAINPSGSGLLCHGDERIRLPVGQMRIRNNLTNPPPCLSTTRRCVSSTI